MLTHSSSACRDVRSWLIAELVDTCRLSPSSGNIYPQRRGSWLFDFVKLVGMLFFPKSSECSRPTKSPVDMQARFQDKGLRTLCVAGNLIVMLSWQTAIAWRIGFLC